MLWAIVVQNFYSSLTMRGFVVHRIGRPFVLCVRSTLAIILKMSALRVCVACLELIPRDWNMLNRE